MKKILCSIVKVKVVNQYRKDPHGSYAYNPTTGTFEYVCIPGTYLITVEYQGEQYEFSGMSTYRKYKYKVGKYVNGILQTKKYENGTTSQKIVDLE